MAYDVFISYRRAGAGTDARMMYDRLSAAGYSVSFDMDTLKNGNFNEELLKRVAECRNFVVLLSAGCFDRTLNGCKREDDWLRLEIAAALYNNRNIVTVMLDGFAFPPKLPPDIDAIRNKNGPKYDLYYIDGFYDRLKKDFLVKEDASGEAAISCVEKSFEPPPSADEGQVDVADLLGDDSGFLRSEAILKYEAISRLLPFSELEALDGVWDDAEKKKAEGDFKSAEALYLKVMDLSVHATPCSLPFALRMAADGIDTRKRDWFGQALARAQGGDVDYEYGVGTVYAGGLGVRRDVSAAFRWYERAAQHGNFPAMAAIGTAYLSGNGVEPNLVAAKAWLEKAAESGLPAAEERLGFLYRNGLGVEQDLARAMDWYQKAAANGNSSARAALGEMYMRGEGVEADRERALAWYRQAAADDQPQALVALAGCLFEQEGSGRSEAITLCRRAVNAGDAEAVVLLGRAYENGWGVDKDVKKAAELYQQALSKGCESAETRLEELKPEVQYLRGVACMEGKTCQRDFSKAREWFEKSAGQGHVEAAGRLAELLQNGLGGKVDVKRAISLYEQADAGGSASAAADLGFMYFQGRKVKGDSAKARSYYERACAGFAKAPESEKWHAVYGYYRLGELYREGKGVEKNPLIAARLFRFAAVNGNVYACHDLGEMYRDGEGVRKSKEESGKWFAAMWKILNESLNPCDHWAMRTAGVAYRDGKGVEHDFAAAATWWRRALEFANPGAASLLYTAMRYHQGLARPGDVERVLEIFTISAEGGDRVAMNNLAIVYQFDSMRIGIQDSGKAFSWRLKSAEAGYPGAMRGLSDMYLSGDGVERDDEKSLEWLIKAADAKDNVAMRRLAIKYMGGTRLGRDFAQAKKLVEAVLEESPDDIYASRLLARMYRDGIGVSENSELARKWYLSPFGMLNREAENENANKIDDLADYYKNGWGVEKDIKRAIELYEKAASSGIVGSMRSLGRLYRFNATGSEDIAKADEWARKYIERLTQKGGGAARGVADSCVDVGNYYRHGYGVKATPNEAYEWFVKAADKNSWAAMLKLASMCRDGEGCTRDLAAAEEWAKRAVAELTPLAENGLAEAQRGLADCYANGWGVEKSPDLAAKWYGEAYDGRDWLATGRLARLYASGEGVAQDLGKAVELLAKSAEKEDAEARCRLGECYERGEWGLDADVAKALELYRQSASEGDAGGLYDLGRCYLEGIGVEKDMGKAQLWLGLAAAEKGDFWRCSIQSSSLLKKIEKLV